MMEKLNILQVGLPRALAESLESRFHDVDWSSESLETASECLQRLLDQTFDILLVGTGLPDVPPERLIEEALRKHGALIAIAVSGNPDYSEATRLAHFGASDYLPVPEGGLPPLDWIEERILIAHGKRNESRLSTAAEVDVPQLVGESKPMCEVKQLIRIIAPRLSTVLISGSTGTGKELAAKAIHAASPRASHNIVTVNCGAIPENLIEAEMFGHVKGAFTGAVTSRIGRFEQAHRGTIFLDEVSEMPMEMQAKLLRVLQEREFQRVGSSETIAVDIRVIAATNRNLHELVRRGGFREDLYYRLNVVPISLPTLAQRIHDVPLLVDHLLQRLCQREKLPLKRLSPEALRRLQEYNWPGNVRQLENALEKAVALSGDRPMLYPSDFPLPALTVSPVAADAPVMELPPEGLNFEAAVTKMQRSLLSQALQRAGGNKKRAADLLGIKRTTFSAKWRVLQQAEKASL